MGTMSTGLYNVPLTIFWTMQDARIFSNALHFYYTRLSRIRSRDGLCTYNGSSAKSTFSIVNM